MPPRAYLTLATLLFGFAAAGCAPSIGDKCVLNTDCSVSGDRQCDTSMPGGYCTIFNCGPNSCPDQTACYLFHASVQGCLYDDRQPSRTAHSFCMKDCHADSDCRPGYVCSDLRGPPWNAILLDDNQSQSSCVPSPDQAFENAGLLPDASASQLPVCQSNPDVNAALPPLPDAAPSGVPDGGTDSGADAAMDAGSDADAGARDSGLDATLDAGALDASDASID